MGNEVNIELRLNGKQCVVNVAPMKRLLDTLREDCDATGTKEGCTDGRCGACTVLVDGEAINACLVATGQCVGAKIKTIEGVGTSDKLARLQAAFVDSGATQCGMCTPGMIMAALALPKRPSLAQIRDGLAGNLCRCTGYAAIVDAVASALRSPERERE